MKNVQKCNNNNNNNKSSNIKSIIHTVAHIQSSILKREKLLHIKERAKEFTKF